MAKPRTYSAPALEKGLDILELVAREAAPLNMAQISERLARSKGEIFRMLLVLEERGYINRRADADGFVITNKLFTLGMEQPLIHSLLDAAMPVMRELAEETWQSCHLVVASLDEIVVIARAESGGDLSYNVRLGHRRPIAQSASGVLLFAFQPESVQEQWLARLARTRRFEQARFLEAAAAARKSHMVRNRSQRVRGLVDLAVPVLQAGVAIATLVIPYLEQDPPRLDLNGVVARLRSAGQEISDTLTRGNNSAPRSATR